MRKCEKIHLDAVYYYSGRRLFPLLLQITRLLCLMTCAFHSGFSYYVNMNMHCMQTLREAGETDFYME